MADYYDTADELIRLLTVEMFGVKRVVQLCLVALFTDGHVLLEGNPGLGKTALVRAFEEVMGLQFGRIQFTPDLMPSDITGTLMPVGEESSLVFKPGPIFTTLLLADEINRATPKTQAAMLEAMAERQVTVLGITHSLTGLGKGTNEPQFFREFRDERGQVVNQEPGRPFMVLATQNPVEHEGTYELPEAQADRFMFKILMPTPNEATLNSILVKTTSYQKPGQQVGLEGRQVDPGKSRLQLRHNKSMAIYREVRDEIKKVEALPSVQKHIANLFLATNGRVSELDTIDRKAQEKAEGLVKGLQFGLGPRAAIALLSGAKGWAKLFVRDVACADGRALASVALPVLRHRMHLTYEGRSDYQERNKELERDRVVDHYLRDLLDATSPTTGKSAEDRRQHQGYRESFVSALNDVIKERGC